MSRAAEFRTDLAGFLAASDFGPLLLDFGNPEELEAASRAGAEGPLPPVELRLRSISEEDETHSVLISVSDEDYPDGTVVTIGASPPQVITARLRKAFDVAKDRIFGAGSPINGYGDCKALRTRPAPSHSSDEPEIIYDAEKGRRYAEDAEEDNEEEDEEDGEEEEEAVEFEDAMESEDEALGSDGPSGLSGQIEACQTGLLPPSAHPFLNHLSGIGLASFGFLVPLLGIKPQTMEAWGLVEDEPLLVRFNDVPSIHFRSGNRPKVVVSLQSEPDKAFAVGKQLEKIYESWLERHWSVEPGKSQLAGGNIIARLWKVATDRMVSLADFCIICDQRHDFPMLLPAVCTRPLCTFAYETLGLMSNVASQAMEMEILDLLLLFFRATVASHRYQVLLDPWPVVFHPDRASEEPVIDPKRKEPGALKAVLEKMPCPSVLFKKGWVEAMKAANPLAFPLTRWLLASNRTFLQLIPEQRQLSFMNTPYQFLMVSDSPAKEEAFARARAAHGDKTLFAFHGSAMENWHSILRKGLLNASGTKMQIHGAAYGNGIYLSPQSAISMGYSRSHGRSYSLSSAPPANRACQLPAKERVNHSCTENNRFIWDEHSLCLAICEVIDSPALKRHNGHGGGIWTLDDPEHCSTRFLILFKPGISQDPQVNLLESRYANAIQAALQARHQHLERVSEAAS